MRCIGASILPFSVVDGNIYFLLGKERCYAPKGTCSDNQWCDFGGRADGNMEEKCAAREFDEETISLVQFDERDVVPRASVDHIEQALRNGQYLYKVKFPVNENGYYVTFVCEIPYDPSVQFKFRSLITSLTTLSSYEKHPAFNITINHSYVEKTDVKWISIPILTIACESSGSIPISACKVSSKLRPHFLYRLKHILAMFPKYHQYRTNWRIDPKNKKSDFEHFNNKSRH